MHWQEEIISPLIKADQEQDKSFVYFTFSFLLLLPRYYEYILIISIKVVDLYSMITLMYFHLILHEISSFIIPLFMLLT